MASDSDADYASETYHVSHEYTDFRGMPGSFEEKIVRAESEEDAIRRAKPHFDHLEDEDSIEVRQW